MTSGPASHSYFSQRLKLHYVEWGEKDAPVLLMIHGMRDHCRNWDWVAKELCKEYRVIAPDLRGHGDSEWLRGGSYYFPDFVADINQLIQQTTKSDEKISIISHSFGGSVSLYYAGVFPKKVEKLIAIEGLGPPPQFIQTMEKTAVDVRMKDWMTSIYKLSARLPKKYESLEAAIARMHEENSHLSDEQARHLSIHGLNQNEDGTWTWKFDNYLRIMSPVRISTEDQKTLWSRVKCPVLLVNGEKSWALAHEKDERAAYFENAEFYTFKDAGHWLHHDKLSEFIDLSRKFLAK
jgi:pimeloyl-ACP methyl ester carboxylesterase